MAMRARVGVSMLRKLSAQRVGRVSATLSTRRYLSADVERAREKETAVRVRERPHDDTKAKINSAWNSSAKSYVDSIQDARGEDGSPQAGFQVGYKIAARLVKSLANKRCEASVIAGEEICTTKATHGEAGEGATACEAHQVENMVRLRGDGAPVILDVASAGGEPAITIAKAIPDSTVYATDFAPTMVDLIRKRVADAGVSNVSACVADGESLTGFGDASVDVVTCTWGLMFMPEWRRAVQEFARVANADGMVVLTLWEKDDESIFQRMAAVLETLTPGFKALIDPERLGNEGASAVVEEMEVAGLNNVTVSQFAVPVTLPPHAGPREIWEYFALNSPLAQSLAVLEAKGRNNVWQEASDMFTSHMMKDWAQGRRPLGLGDAADARLCPQGTVFSMRALLVVGRKQG